MKIGILGTRGIPNRYGGFEEFAEQVSLFWSKFGHEVYVYCMDSPESEKIRINNPKVKQIYVQSPKLGPLEQIIYDYKCTKHAVNSKLDIIYHAGYQSSVLGNMFFKKKLKGRLVYNMDGLEWKRSKYNYLTRKLTKYFEKLAVFSGAALISDNKGIKDYLYREYGKKSYLIEYGAIKYCGEPTVVSQIPDNFDLTIARFEPENNILNIINCYRNSNRNLVIVANSDTQLYKKNKYLFDSYGNILFLGPIYNKSELAFLRGNCQFYIHGHSVGGTNPSLLEAMISGAKILANDNEFNRDVLGDFGHYWKTDQDLLMLITHLDQYDKNQEQIKYCTSRYSWDSIAEKHLNIFNSLLSK